MDGTTHGTCKPQRLVRLISSSTFRLLTRVGCICGLERSTRETVTPVVAVHGTAHLAG